MRRILTCIAILAGILILSMASAQAYYVRIKDLTGSPTPPNPVTVSGKVTNTSPLTINDGSGDLILAGLSASSNDFLVVKGNWDGSLLTVDGHAEAYVGAARTQMVYVPAGDFLMGSPSGVGNSNERPQHSVYLPGYWIGKHTVTRGEYRQFMESGGYEDSTYWSDEGWAWRSYYYRTEPAYWAPEQNWSSGTFTQTDNHPVVGVSWYEAEAFCNWAGGKMPTEAQWEKGARWDAGLQHPRVYPWGDIWDAEKCNNRDDTLYVGAQTAPVASYPAGVSPYGLHDMAGNVSEWVYDWYSATYYSQTPPEGWIDPEGPTTGNYRVLRGGHFDSLQSFCRSAYRSYGNHSALLGYCGFRVCR